MKHLLSIVMKKIMKVEAYKENYSHTKCYKCCIKSLNKKGYKDIV